jgi:murein DD-endopeptidase MepM/ murein hydrolase activator NlpD
LRVVAVALFLTAVVPVSARAAVWDAFPRLTSTFPEPAPTADTFEFPVVGPHRIGTLPDQRFGGIRGHKGQDVFASCGTPVIVAIGGRVYRSTYEGGAGNYAVIDGADGRWYVYMHLRRPAAVSDGDHVALGQAIGEVGHTGDADGCHLHFEIWTAPGWYQGGRPIDPYGMLRDAEARAAVAMDVGRVRPTL